ncbi:unannotated protein [freshwater metagenome]|uniref:Unannotated protein n=1 Tax=freshwater metagenome TaxID=449393 RepID=A0A6J7I933_9ZZZZ|nr:glycerophosphodiester phosphodiesterase [Actinomycetota bacterium]
MSRIRFALALACIAGLAASLAPAASAATNLWRKARPLNIAHQGGEDEFPSNTMYAFKRAVRAGADMLELDVGVTKDGQVVIRHDTTLDATTNGTGTIASHTLRQIKLLDAAYWFSPTGAHYAHDHPVSAYRFRGVATGKREAPRGFKAADFKVATLKEVLKAFPRTPINIEIKGRTTAEGLSEYLTNARALARALRGVKRTDLIVVSFKQPAVELFHTLAPRFALAPGVDGVSGFLLGGASPGAGVTSLQVPITYRIGGNLITVSSEPFITKAHDAGYAWHVWFSNDDVDGPTSWATLIGRCVDGVMTSRPVAFERTLRATPSPSACRA